MIACPSRLEGFGYPLLEGMAAGVAVVATDGGSQSEILGPGWSPCLPENLAQEIDGLFKDEAKRTARIRQGLARATLLSIPAMAESTMAVYRRACGRV